MIEDSILTRRVGGHGVELSASVSGTGEPVVFLHGFPESARSWRRQMTAVTQAGFSAWAPNLRGYNGSDRPGALEAYRLDHLVADVVEIVRTSGACRAHIVGHDWGGIIAWTVAARFPAIVRSLVILNAPHPGVYRHKVWRTSQFFRSWYVGLFLVPQLPELLLSARDYSLLRRLFSIEAGPKAPFSREDVDAYVDQFRAPGALTAALNYYRANAGLGSAEDRNQLVTAPTLVLWGDRDKALSPVLLDGLHAFVRDLQVRRFANVGHWIQNEAPDEVNRALVDFLTHHGHGGS
jgi:pimeloyl-ACP methyl ester carboxylesterase